MCDETDFQNDLNKTNISFWAMTHNFDQAVLLMKRKILVFMIQ